MPVPVVPSSGNRGLRTVIVWAVLLLALAALIAGLVVHLAQIHSGAAAVPGPTAASTAHVAALDLLATLGAL